MNQFEPVAKVGIATLCVMLSDCAGASVLVTVKVPSNWPPPGTFVVDRNSWSFQELVVVVLPTLLSVQMTWTFCPAPALAGARTLVAARSGYGASEETTLTKLVLLLSPVPPALYSNTASPMSVMTVMRKFPAPAVPLGRVKL